MKTSLQFISPTGVTHSFELLDDPGVVRFDPAWYQSAARFIRLGFSHLVAGADYVVFLLCLVIPFRRFRVLLPLVVSFTFAQIVTLIAGIYGYAPDSLWFPPLIETLIAACIVYLALENIVGKTTERRRQILALGTGLVLGYSYSFALAEALQLAVSHRLISVLSFGAGIGLGQVLALMLLILALEALFLYVVEERMGTVIVSALVVLTVWRSMLDHGVRLWQYQFHWPELAATSRASALRGGMLILILALLVWALLEALGAWRKRYPDQDSTRAPQHRQNL